MANPFVKKTWQKRLTQFPTRRTLTDVSSGNVQTVDFARAEGEVYQEGDGFTEQNMNNLEDRIEEAFDGVGEESSYVPRSIPKDITEYYRDGSLKARIRGTGNYRPFEDIHVGDYFKLSRPITAPNVNNQLSSGEVVTGSQYVVIVDMDGNRNAGGHHITCMPYVLDPSSLPYKNKIIGHFGKARFHSSQDLTSVGYADSEINRLVLGNFLNNPPSASTDDNATIVQQLFAEFGSPYVSGSNSLLSVSQLYVIDSLNSNGEPNASSGNGSYICYLPGIVDFTGISLAARDNSSVLKTQMYQHKFLINNYLTLEPDVFISTNAYSRDIVKGCPMSLEGVPLASEAITLSAYYVCPMFMLG